MLYEQDKAPECADVKHVVFLAMSESESALGVITQELVLQGWGDSG